MIASTTTLFPAWVRATLPPLYGQEGTPDPTVYARFFTPDSRWTWYATEFEPEEGRFFGLVDGFEPELGYFLLEELETSRGPLGVPIERDRHFAPAPLSTLRQATGMASGRTRRLTPPAPAHTH